MQAKDSGSFNFDESFVLYFLSLKFNRSKVCKMEKINIIKTGNKKRNFQILVHKENSRRRNTFAVGCC